MLVNALNTSLNHCKRLGGSVGGNIINYAESSQVCEVMSCKTYDLQVVETNITDTTIYVKNNWFSQGN